MDIDQTIDLPTTEDEVIDQALAEVTAAQILDGLALTEGNITDMLTDGQLTTLGSQVIEDYEADRKDRDDWERVARESLERASQEKGREDKTYPWTRASNVQYPLLTVAALQFNARAYHAIVKGDEAVSVKVVGSDKGMPQVGPDGQPMMTLQGMPLVQSPQGPALASPQGLVPIAALPPEQQQELQQVPPEPMWQRPPGAKAKRALRVKEYLNTTIFYRMDGWEADTDMLLVQLPIIGCAFRKVYYEAAEKKQCSKLVSALNLVVPCDTKEIKTAARISEVLPMMAPYEILESIRSGYFRSPEFLIGEDFDAKPRKIIEQHLRYDLDGDNYPEPYIVTVDHESHEVLRVVANYGPNDIKRSPAGMLTKIKAGVYYVKYGFFPHPEGKFYDIGLGHLLASIGNVVDTLINQMIDANTAMVAGGGFIGSGARLQGTNRSSTIRMQPGEWKSVNVPGDQLRNAMVERTLPQISPVQFNILEMMLGAAQDISSTKDVLTGDASNNGQVGTTLALIEQGLQSFTAIYKRIYRSLKDEYSLLAESIERHAGPEEQADYVNILDEPDANLREDFNSADMDIRPVSDPSNVTKMQKMQRAQFLLSTGPMATEAMTNPVIRAMLKRAYEAADVEDIDELLIEAPQPPPDPRIEAEATKDMADAGKAQAQAAEIQQRMSVERVEKAVAAYFAGEQMGMAA